MTDEAKQEGQKTVVSFVAGLLIGGLLVWIFSGTPETEAPTDTPTGDTITDSSDQNGPESNATSEDTSADTEDAPDTTTSNDDPSVSMDVGEGSAQVPDQPAGMSVTLEGATFPTEEGWIAVRTYQNEQLGNILGAARYSQSQGLVPTEVPLLAGTVAGGQYAVVFFSDDGNREFNIDGDAQLDTEISVFTAQ